MDDTVNISSTPAAPADLTGLRVAVTGASRDFGRTLAIRFAERGAEVFLSARSLAAATKVADEIRGLGHEQVRPFACDLSDPASIRAFGTAVGELTDRLDVLVNNGSRWLAGTDLLSCTDDEVSDTIASGATGTVLTVRAFLPLLLASDCPDIVNMVSTAGVPGLHRSEAHGAFYAAKSAQAGFAGVLSKRLRPQGVRVISLYPPDFANPDPLSPEWETTPRGAGDGLTAHSLVECVMFAIRQPRDCFISAFHFEQAE
ncbi:NAD(P)-dependent dehydrogenase (short-subunit alcohol dehydrogenase family) [Kitasatospora gansuensis]|uniref:NAD(P)-dependent dehydrogenase (Short-subunit alcohol dehydrogenase family) n=1 Tax=Kitasatospora gansuensis TaxID=258050 RepID=A0A7W7SIF3_9ACTN|nr:SDR family oxidoreductase [Kitasatospora gansuensis]MBB4950468.1 NAD(P)-dependent dehydrogenase (short-subunit alcohol dehydrogenase family) [Kitasatospora gansuensis]